MNSLKAVIDIERPDVVFITETWFNKNSVVNIPGYSIYQKDRISKKRGGGVCIYVKSSCISCEFLQENLELNDPVVETVWCTIRFEKENILIGCIYRPPNMIGEANSQLNGCFEKLSLMIQESKCTGLLIVGDFNYPGISWDHSGQGTIIKEDKLVKNFKDAVEDGLLYQNVTFPTFQEKDDSPKRTLDLIFTENKNRIFEIESQPPLGGIKKAHLVLKWKYSLTDSLNDSIFRRSCFNFRKGDYKSFGDFISSKDWISLFNDLNIQECYDKFIDIYNEGCSKFVPEYSFKNEKQSKEKWMNSHIRKLYRNRNRLWRINKTLGWKNRKKKREYYNLKKEIELAIIESVKTYEKDLIDIAKKKPKLFYSYINSRQKVKEQIRGLRNKDGEIVKTPKEIANILNKQFESVFEI
jgi:hypothetical protein